MPHGGRHPEWNYWPWENPPDDGAVVPDEDVGDVPENIPQTYEEIIKLQGITDYAKFLVISDRYPDRLMEWLLMSKEDEGGNYLGGGQNWLLSRSTIEGVVDLGDKAPPDTRYFDLNTGSFVDTAYGEELYRRARGEEPEAQFPIPDDAEWMAPDLYYSDAEGRYFRESGVTVGDQIAQQEIDAYERDIAPPEEASPQFPPQEDAGEGREWQWDGNEWVSTETPSEEDDTRPPVPGGATAGQTIPSAQAGQTAGGSGYYYWDGSDWMWAWSQIPQGFDLGPGGVLIPREDEGVELPPDAVEIVPGQLFRLPDGTYVNQNGQPVDENTAQQIIESWEQGLEPPGITPAQQAQLDLEAQRIGISSAQLAEQQRQFNLNQQRLKEENLANLMANPASWLEYALAAGEPGVVQPWMMGLLPEEFGDLRAGDVIPGVQWGVQELGQPPAPPPTTDIRADFLFSPEDMAARITFANEASSTAEAETEKLAQQAFDRARQQVLDDEEYENVDEASRVAIEARAQAAGEQARQVTMQERQFAARQARDRAGEQYYADLIEQGKFPYAQTPSGERITPAQPVAQPVAQPTIPSLKGMPALTRPSAQYQARMGPTAFQQFAGYKKARTGEPPENLQWRLWNLAPPGGGRRFATTPRR